MEYFGQEIEDPQPMRIRLTIVFPDDDEQYHIPNFHANR